MIKLLDIQITRFKRLNLGLRRLLLVLYGGWWTIWLANTDEFNGLFFLFVLIVYWIIVAMILWVLEGFQNQ